MNIDPFLMFGKMKNKGSGYKKFRLCNPKSNHMKILFKQVANCASSTHFPTVFSLLGQRYFRDAFWFFSSFFVLHDIFVYTVLIFVPFDTFAFRICFIDGPYSSERVRTLELSNVVLETDVCVCMYNTRCTDVHLVTKPI